MRDCWFHRARHYYYGSSFLQCLHLFGIDLTMPADTEKTRPIQSTQTTHVTRPKIIKNNWTTELSGWVSGLDDMGKRINFYNRCAWEKEFWEERERLSILLPPQPRPQGSLAQRLWTKKGINGRESTCRIRTHRAFWKPYPVGAINSVRSSVAHSMIVLNVRAKKTELPDGKTCR